MNREGRDCVLLEVSGVRSEISPTGGNLAQRLKLITVEKTPRLLAEVPITDMCHTGRHSHEGGEWHVALPRSLPAPEVGAKLCFSELLVQRKGIQSAGDLKRQTWVSL